MGASAGPGRSSDGPRAARAAGVRIGVDVGGTFTKALAYDLALGEVVAEAVVATTHDHELGVASGVVTVVGRIAERVGSDSVELITHSTTQAVNALLEGDVAVVGIVGVARQPDVGRARRRTVVPPVDLGSGRKLRTEHAFLDATGGLDPGAARSTVEELRSRGAESVAVAGAFAPDDDADEQTVAAAARDLGLPVTTSADLSGLYGLELRSVTAALNACILPVAMRTAAVVEAGVREVGIACPVMVMRGDGGATDLAGFRRAPARTLYSGPAASVAGALRSGRIEDGIIIEVGGTSSNIAAIRRGQPALSYVQAGGHVTALRAIDVRVLGVAGGSMLRVRRGRVHGVGPRSAHIAGCGYACFTDVGALDGATVELVAPRPGDAADHVVLVCPDGRRVALTNTCAANALGLVRADDHAAGDPEAALAAFEVVAAVLRRVDGPEVARRMLQASTQAVGDVVAAVADDHDLRRPVLVAVGGGAGGLGRAVAAGMGLEVVVPDHAPLISALGDALSLVRVEREITASNPAPAEIEALVEAAEAEAVRAGAAANSLDVRVEHEKDRNTLRVVVTGAIGLRTGAVPGRPEVSRTEVGAIASDRGYPEPRPVGRFWVAEVADGRRRAFVADRYGDVLLDIDGAVVSAAEGEGVAAMVERRTRQVGPMTIRPDAWLIHGGRFLHVDGAGLAGLAERAASVAAVEPDAIVVIGRE